MKLILFNHHHLYQWSIRHLDPPLGCNNRGQVVLDTRCYNCGSTSHLIRLCPHAVKNRYTEAPGNLLSGKKGNESMDSNCVSNIGVTRESSQNNYNKDCESRDDIGGEL